MTYQTDERLKSYLDTNQLHREQMCLAVLAIDKRFSDVRPRHPRGGPDGGRDIEAIFNGVQRTYAASGFVNQANDSGDHKKKIIAKFKDDLTSALEQQPQPEVFVFFTNINLTAGEKDDLIKAAKAKGIVYADIFDRERIRIVLDSADGFSIRFQYLNIALSEAEQATFFARWGNDIQGLISDGFVKLQRSLNRIHFLQEAALPLSHFTAKLELDKEYTGSEIEHFRAFTFLHLKGPVNGIFSFVFGSSDNGSRLEAKTIEDLKKEESGINKSICGGDWEMIASKKQPDFNDTNAGDGEKNDGVQYKVGARSRSAGRSTVKDIFLRYNRDSFIRFETGLSLQDIDECGFVFCLNRSLAEKVKAIHIYANEYKLTELSGFNIDPSPFPWKVPLFFSEQELADPWIRLRPASASTFQIRFSEQTPKRFFDAIDLED